MRQVESLTELYFATAKAIPSLFAIAESMQVAFSRGKSHLSLSTPHYSKPDIGSTWYGNGSKGNGWYSYDHKGVRFIELVNVVQQGHGQASAA